MELFQLPVQMYPAHWSTLLRGTDPLHQAKMKIVLIGDSSVRAPTETILQALRASRRAKWWSGWATRTISQAAEGRVRL